MPMTSQTTKDLETIIEILDQRIHEVTAEGAAGDEADRLTRLKARVCAEIG